MVKKYHIKNVLWALALLGFIFGPARSQEQTPATKATPREISDYYFKDRDRDHDGVLTPFEFVLYSKLRFAIIDIDKNGYTTLEEYRRTIKDSPDARFRQEDLDKDGKITQFESLRDAHKIFDKVDKNHDGVVTPDEYFESRNPASRH